MIEFLMPNATLKLSNAAKPSVWRKSSNDSVLAGDDMPFCHHRPTDSQEILPAACRIQRIRGPFRRTSCALGKNHDEWHAG
jgi:hypothetical protein